MSEDSHKSPPLSSPPEPEEPQKDLQVVLTETGDIKYATRERLVSLLFSEAQESPEYVLEFILTMELFMKPTEFYEIIVQRLSNAENYHEKEIVLSVLDTWISVMWTPSTDKTLVRLTEALIKRLPLEDTSKSILDSLKEKTAPRPSFNSLKESGSNDDNGDEVLDVDFPIPLAFRVVEITPEKPVITLFNTNVKRLSSQCI